jgi:hypothetical protein
VTSTLPRFLVDRCGRARAVGLSGALSRACGRAIRAVGLVLGFGLIVSVAGFLVWADQVTGWGADKLLANARPPARREMAPTAHGQSYGAPDIQLVGGQGEGLNCSIGSLVERFALPTKRRNASVSLQMRQACVFHDYCYRHGAATYGYSQADCDYILLEQAYRTCRFVYEASTVSECVRKARQVGLGVRLGGNEPACG